MGLANKKKYIEEEFVQSGPVRLLEAVYCDPCKAKVFCCFLSANPMHDHLYGFFHPHCSYAETFHRHFPLLLTFVPSYLDVNGDGTGFLREFYDKRVVKILKMIFEGLDVNSDGLVKQEEAYLKNLISPGFLRNITGEVFDFLDNDNDGDLDMEDIPYCRRPGLLKNETIENCPLLYFPFDQICTTLIKTLFSPNSNVKFDLISEVRVEQRDLENIVVNHIFQFFAKKKSLFQEYWRPNPQPSQLSRAPVVGLEDFAKGLTKLREPPIVTNSLVQLLTPIVNSFPRMILQALVNSADKNSDGGMDWQEFEGFGDFDLAFRTRRLMTAVLNDDILADMNNCNGDQKCLPTLWTMEELKRYFSTPSVINRLVTNLVFHPEFQFPSQYLQE